jgi:predicted Zn-dependent protease
MPSARASQMPPARASQVPPASQPPTERPSQAPDRVEHALERASRLVRERARAEGAAEAARAIEAAQDHVTKKQYADAEPLVRAACNADPDNPEYLALHAWLRVQIGEHAVPAFAAQIVSALDRAVMKAPMSVPVRFYRAQVLKRLGRDEEAYKDFRFVARRAPDQLDAVREVRLHAIRTRNKQKQSGVFSRLFHR